MSKQPHPKLMGAFVLAAAALIVIVFVIFESGALLKKSSNYVVFFEADASGMRVGSPVKVSGVEIGSIKNIKVHFAENEKFRIEVIIEIVEGVLMDTLGLYEDMADHEFINHLIDKGLRAQLETQNLVTGLKQIKLDFFPDTPVNRLGWNNQYIEFPSIPSVGQELQHLLQKISHKLDEIPLTEIAADVQTVLLGARATLEGVNGMVNSPEMEQSLASLSRSLEASEKLIVDINSYMEPLRQDKLDVLLTSLIDTSEKLNNTLERSDEILGKLESIADEDQHQLRIALKEMTKSGRSLRMFLDQLQRNPRALFFGK